MLMEKKLRDVGIALGAALSAVTAMYVFVIRPWQLRRGATDEEVNRELPGDDLVPNSKHGYTQAITIDAPPAKVWPWVVQIGYKRAGWYSHDGLHRMMGIAGSVENEEQSAERIIPELQDLKVGDVIEIAPEMGYRVVRLEPERAMVLLSRVATIGDWRSLEDDEPLSDEYLISSWTWYLEEIEGGKTRLIVRVRSDYSGSLGTTLAVVVPNELGSLVMQPKTMQGIKGRVEAA
jgi:hypothetical protein